MHSIGQYYTDSSSYANTDDVICSDGYSNPISDLISNFFPSCYSQSNIYFNRFAVPICVCPSDIFAVVEPFTDSNCIPVAFSNSICNGLFYGVTNF